MLCTALRGNVRQHVRYMSVAFSKPARCEPVASGCVQLRSVAFSCVQWRSVAFSGVQLRSVAFSGVGGVGLRRTAAGVSDADVAAR